MTVCSLTPSRMGIITLRLVWSKLSFFGVNLAGISLGNAGYVAGGLVSVWAIAGTANHAIAHTGTRRDDAGVWSFMLVLPEADRSFCRMTPRNTESARGPPSRFRRCRAAQRRAQA